MTSTSMTDGTAVSSIRSEDALSNQWDKCFADSLIKLGSGFIVGVGFSLMLFKRRKWPIMLGSGIGLGIGMTNCQRNLNDIVTGKMNV